MKKLLALILCLILMLSLAACGKNDSIDWEADEKEESKISQTDEDEEKEDNDEKDNDKDDEDKVTTKFSRGKINGNKYSSKFSGITFKKPSSWDFLSDDEVLEILGATVDEDTVEELIESGSGYDVAAKNASGNSVLIGYENLAANNAEDMDEEEYMEYITAALEQAGYEFDSIDEIELCGNDYLYQEMSVKASGVTVEQAYCVRKIGKYISFIIITSTDEDIDTILDMFS